MIIRARWRSFRDVREKAAFMQEGAECDARAPLVLATAAMNIQARCATLFRLYTSLLTTIFHAPTSPMLNPVTVNGYACPRYSRTPSPHVNPTPAATDMLSIETFPIVSSAAHVGAAVNASTASPMSVSSNDLLFSIT